MIEALIVVMMLVFAVQAIRTPRLLSAALWLAGISALLATFLYRLGAAQVAVVELSVGAGLVTVLFVFAISVAGEETTPTHPCVPWLLAATLALAVVVLLLGLALPLTEMPVKAAEQPLSQVFWDERGLDVLVQVVLIFSGVLGLLGLLAEAKAPLEKSAAAEVTIRRDRELLELQQKALQ